MNLIASSEHGKRKPEERVHLGRKREDRHVIVVNVTIPPTGEQRANGVGNARQRCHGVGCFKER